MHLRLSREERCQLNRVAARLALSPSATIRFLVNAEDRRNASEMNQRSTSEVRPDAPNADLPGAIR